MKKCIYLFIALFIMSCGKDIDKELTVETGNVEIEGNVINDDGINIKDVSVALYNAGVLIASTESNESGKYKIKTSVDLNEDSNLFLKASKPGYSSSFRTVEDCESGVAELSLAITDRPNLAGTDNGNALDDGMVSIRGRVIDNNGDSGRARAIVIKEDGYNSSLVDQNGCYELFVEKGSQVELYYFTGCNTNMIEADEDTPFNFFHKSKTLPFIVEENIIAEDVVTEGLYNIFEIKGLVTDCSGSPIKEGIISFNEFYKFDIKDGKIMSSRVDCFLSPENLEYVVYDGCTGLRTPIMRTQSIANKIDIGQIQVCDQQDHFMDFKIGEREFIFCERSSFSNQDQFTGDGVYEINAFTSNLEHAITMTLIPEVNNVYTILGFSIFEYSNEDESKSIFFGSNIDIKIRFEEGIKEFGGLNMASISGSYSDIPSEEILEVSGSISLPTSNDFYFF